MPRDDAVRRPCGFAGVVVLVLVAASCGASSRGPAEDASLDAGLPLRDAAADASGDAAADASGDAVVDSGLDYDCDAACSREPPICVPPPFGGDCLGHCREIVVARGCGRGEALRLLRCLEDHPGACEDDYGEGPCAEEWHCYLLCVGDSFVVCRPPPE